MAHVAAKFIVLARLRCISGIEPSDDFPRQSRPPWGAAMTAIRYPTRYRRVPHGPHEFAVFHAECAALLDRHSARRCAARPRP